MRSSSSAIISLRLDSDVLRISFQAILPTEAMNGKIFITCCNKDGGNSCKLNLKRRLTEEGVKPPNGAMVKSHGTARFGKDKPRVYRVWIKEINESEPLRRCREVETHGVCYKVRSAARTCLLAVRQTSSRRHELYPGFIREVGNLHRNVRQLKLWRLSKGNAQ